MLTIRAIEERDIGRIVTLGESLKHESPEYRGMRFAPGKAGRFVAQAADDSIDHVTGWVAVTEKDEVVGFIMGYTSTHIFFDDVITWDGTLYLQSRYRGTHGDIVARLIDLYIDWAKQWDGPIKFGLTTDIETGRLERMFHRRGFQTTGRILTYVRRRTRETGTN